MKKTGDIWAVKDLLRHSRLGTTFEYLYTTPEDMQEGISMLDAWYKNEFCTSGS